MQFFQHIIIVLFHHCNSISIAISLWFQYHDDTDVGFSSSLACSLVLLLLIGGLQAVILPRTIILLLLFLTAFIWVSVVLMLLLAVRLQWILWDISQSFVLRLAITVFTIVLIYTVAQVNVVSIPSNTICNNPVFHIGFISTALIVYEHIDTVLYVWCSGCSYLWSSLCAHVDQWRIEIVLYPCLVSSLEVTLWLSLWEYLCWIV
jgi:hypothetical protein